MNLRIRRRYPYPCQSPHFDMQRVLSGLVVIALLCAACTVGATPGTTALPNDSSSPGGSSTTSNSEAVTSTTIQLTSTTLLQQPLGLLTPSGVTVAILKVMSDGYRVMTPCGNEASVATGVPLGPVDVVIDPGHGGPIDTGAVAPTGLVERDLNLDLATLTERRLRVRGFTVAMTRTADYATPLEVRAHLADRLKARIMVSIHHNAPTPGPSDVPGVEVFVQNDSEESQRLGGLLWAHTMEALGKFDIAWSAASDAGVMTVLNTRGSDAYGILRRPATPSALLELGYLSNRAEAELFATPEYVMAASVAVADAIEAYLTTDAVGVSLGEGRVFDPNPGVGKDVCVEPDLG